MTVPNPKDIDDRLAVASQLAEQTRGITLHAYRSSISADNKASDHYDPVTAADRDAEAFLRAGISAAFPDDTINGEEFPDKTGDNDWAWCLDPIDGTRAFIAGVPVWSTLIGITYKNKPVIGIIDMPVLGERYIGAHGKAYCESARGTEQLKTRPCKEIKDIVLACTEPFAMFSPGQKAAYEMIRRTARFSRLGLDAYGYALLAAGKIDVVLEAGLQPYDVMALIPIIEGAGGVLTDWHGNSGQEGGAVVCGGDPQLVDQLYMYLGRALDG